MWIVMAIMIVGCVIMEWPMKPKKKSKEKEDKDGCNRKDR